MQIGVGLGIIVPFFILTVVMPIAIVAIMFVVIALMLSWAVGNLVIEMWRSR